MLLHILLLLLIAQSGWCVLLGEFLRMVLKTEGAGKVVKESDSPGEKSDQVSGGPGPDGAEIMAQWEFPK